MKHEKFNSKKALENYKVIRGYLGLDKNFSLAQLIKAIEDSGKYPIEVTGEVMQGNVSGYSVFDYDREVFIVKYNLELDEKLALRTKLHELAHVVRRDPLKKEKANQKCYISRDYTLYDGPEYEVEFIASMWLKHIIRSDLDLANRDWIGDR